MSPIHLSRTPLLLLVAVVNAGHADIAIVGSEVLLRGDLTPAQFLDAISRVRSAIPDSVPVTTAETCDMIQGSPAILDAVDLLFVNHYPYWKGVALDDALAALDLCHERVLELSGGKPVVISETGWPTCGETVGQAVPSPGNAGRYYRDFVSWARTHEVAYFYFEAFDDAWKASGEGPQGACWGIWDRDGILKPAMSDVFTGGTILESGGGSGGDPSPGDR